MRAALYYYCLFMHVVRLFGLLRKMKMCPKHSEKHNHVFSQVFNPLSGKTEWDMHNGMYDYHQEIARSAYADMLHDEERNQKYFQGLKWAISHLRSQGRPVRVLDIGTGTGLLSMMAAKLGADEITACEAFEPMAECAEKVIQQNGLENRIKVVWKRSNELRVGPGLDMLQKANLLVTEVFDTELIGEGAISTFNYAHEHLLEKDCLVVPSRATVFAQLVESPILWRFHQVNPIPISEGTSVLPPEEVSQCSGSAAVFDIQMSQLPKDSYRTLTDPITTFRFDFTGAESIPDRESVRVPFDVRRTGQCDAIFFWWDLEMDGKGEVILSCAPWWMHKKGTQQPWRDHWMQAVYFPQKSRLLNENRAATLSCSHDEYSLWFDVATDEESCTPSKSKPNQIQRPICTCGLHVVCNPNRIGMINDEAINKKMVSAMQKLVKPKSVCMCFGNGVPLLSLMAAKLGAEKVYAIDSEPLSKRILEQFVKKNNLEHTVKILDKKCEDINEEDLEGNKVDVFLGEPYFLSSVLPWHNLYYWHALNATSKLKSSDSRCLPREGRVWAVGMHFDHLWKIRHPVKNVEGFQMDCFDNLIQGSSDVADSPIEPHPLWEYPGIAVTEAFQLISFDLTQSLPTKAAQISGTIPFRNGGMCNGIAIWMEWMLDSELSISRGPTGPIAVGHPVTWDMTSRQGVHLLETAQNITGKILTYTTTVSANCSTLDFKFVIS